MFIVVRVRFILKLVTHIDLGAWMFVWKAIEHIGNLWCIVSDKFHILFKNLLIKSTEWTLIIIGVAQSKHDKIQRDT